MIRSHKFRARPGHYLQVCDLSGFVGWDDEIKEMWDGKMVLDAFYETRHPQDFVKDITVEPPPKPIQSEGDDEFIADKYPNGVTFD